MNAFDSDCRVCAVYTDELKSYDGLTRAGYFHRRIAHSRGFSIEGVPMPRCRVCGQEDTERRPVMDDGVGPRHKDCVAQTP